MKCHFDATFSTMWNFVKHLSAMKEISSNNILPFLSNTFENYLIVDNLYTYTRKNKYMNNNAKLLKTAYLSRSKFDIKTMRTYFHFCNIWLLVTIFCHLSDNTYLLPLITSYLSRSRRFFPPSSRVVCRAWHKWR